jgi:8-oxo-dGTP pyrophosphatase MutT (NUDIX family)
MSLPVRDKVVAYVLRFDGDGMRLAVFDHVGIPEAGTQVPSGGIEPGESPEAACLREVAEESGLTGARILRRVGAFEFLDTSRGERQIRYVFVLAAPQGVAETWDHAVTGEGADRGMMFRYRWLPPDEAERCLVGKGATYLPQARLDTHWTASE